MRVDRPGERVNAADADPATANHIAQVKAAEAESRQAIEALEDFQHHH